MAKGALLNKSVHFYDLGMHTGFNKYGISCLCALTFYEANTCSSTLHGATKPCNGGNAHNGLLLC